MKVSIFTPTHNPTWLLDAYFTLWKQTYQNWEWIIQPNGFANCGVDIPPVIASDPRVQILPYTVSDGVGCLKKICCFKATGDLFLELDHDDWLTSDALATVVATAQETGAGFIFSDSVHYFEDNSDEVFGAAWGWEHYKHTYEGREHTVMKSFDVCPRSLCEIFWSPNHVRVWTREAYEKVGGHSGQLRVGDDHDLMCRTYLAGFKFAHIARPLYFYRRFKNSETNTFVVENSAVQQQQRANKDRYLQRLIIEWCKREKLAMLDLGGAHNCPKELGFTSVDLHDADILCDVTQGIPVEENSVGVFRADDFLEHIPIAKVPNVMNRLYRHLAPGGWIISETPSVTDSDGKVGRGAFQDCSHVSYWSENNTWYFTDRNYAKYVPEIKCRFQTVNLKTDYPSQWHRQHQIPYMYWDAVALKGQRCPGRQLI